MCAIRVHYNSVHECTQVTPPYTEHIFCLSLFICSLYKMLRNSFRYFVNNLYHVIKYFFRYTDNSKAKSTLKINLVRTTCNKHEHEEKMNTHTICVSTKLQITKKVSIWL